MIHRWVTARCRLLCCFHCHSRVIKLTVKTGSCLSKILEKSKGISLPLWGACWCGMDRRNWLKPIQWLDTLHSTELQNKFLSRLWHLNGNILPMMFVSWAVMGEWDSLQINYTERVFLLLAAFRQQCKHCCYILKCLTGIQFHRHWPRCSGRSP